MISLNLPGGSNEMKWPDCECKVEWLDCATTASDVVRIDFNVHKHGVEQRSGLSLGLLQDEYPGMSSGQQTARFLHEDAMINPDRYRDIEFDIGAYNEERRVAKQKFREQWMTYFKRVKPIIVEDG